MRRVGLKPHDWLKPAAVSFSGLLDGGVASSTRETTAFVATLDLVLGELYEVLNVVTRMDSARLVIGDNAVAGHVRNFAEEDIDTALLEGILVVVIAGQRVEVESDKAVLARYRHNVFSAV